MKQKIYIAALLAGMLALAGCGGGSSGISETAAKERAEKAVEDALAGITPCEGDGVMVDDDGKCVRDQDHMSDADKAEAMKDLGEAMYAALGGPGVGDSETGDALGNTTTSILGTTLAITGPEGAGALGTGANPGGVLEPVAGADVDPLGSWKGMDYALSTTGTNAHISHEARVYTNQGANTSVEFSKVPGDLHNLETSGANEGRVIIDIAGERALVMADAFLHSGQQTHPLETNRVYISVRGTYDGAPGEFQCTPTDPATCSSTNDGKGSPSLLAGGVWTFKPDPGATVSQPDANYLYFGWWVHKDSDGDPLAASAFMGRSSVADSGDSSDGLDLAPDLDSLTGSATYTGAAVGKFALNNAIDGTGDSGHFTADAEFKATFSGDTPVGVTGTIDNFRLNDGSEDPKWSVSLARGGLGSAGAIVAPTTANAGTIWSINDNKAAPSGSWSGTMYDEMPGDADDTPPGDGSNIPTTVTGTFYSEFNNAGRMVGAFGANKQ